MNIHGRLARLERAARDAEWQCVAFAALVERLYARFGRDAGAERFARAIQQTCHECGGNAEQWVRETLGQIRGPSNI